MNLLFETAPLTWNQWLICLLPMIPMIPTALLVNRIDPPQANASGNAAPDSKSPPLSRHPNG